LTNAIDSKIIDYSDYTIVQNITALSIVAILEKTFCVYESLAFLFFVCFNF